MESQTTADHPITGYWQIGHTWNGPPNAWMGLEITGTHIPVRAALGSYPRHPWAGWPIARTGATRRSPD